MADEKNAIGDLRNEVQIVKSGDYCDAVGMKVPNQPSNLQLMPHVEVTRWLV
jgi:hypothetical protein